jgi:hypothetical protein
MRKKQLASEPGVRGEVSDVNYLSETVGILILADYLLILSDGKFPLRVSGQRAEEID